MKKKCEFDVDWCNCMDIQLIMVLKQVMAVEALFMLLEGDSDLPDHWLMIDECKCPRISKLHHPVRWYAL
jgi:hypothetical protein